MRNTVRMRQDTTWRMTDDKSKETKGTCSKSKKGNRWEHKRRDISLILQRKVVFTGSDKSKKREIGEKGRKERAPINGIFGHYSLKYSVKGNICSYYSAIYFSRRLRISFLHFISPCFRVYNRMAGN